MLGMLSILGQRYIDPSPRMREAYSSYALSLVVTRRQGIPNTTY